MSQQQWKKPIVSVIQAKASALKKRPCRIALVEVDGRDALCLFRHNILSTKPIKGMLDDLNVDEMESIMKALGVPASRTRLIKHKEYGHNIGVYAFLDEVGVILPQNVKPTRSPVDHSHQKTTRQQERKRFRQAYATSVAHAKDFDKPHHFRQAYAKSVAHAGQYRKQLQGF